jgi:hypothetical protein
MPRTNHLGLRAVSLCMLSLIVLCVSSKVSPVHARPFDVQSFNRVASY